MNKLDTKHASSNEPIDARRKTALRSVEVQQKLHDEFAEKFGFLDSNQMPDIEAAFSHLDATFFRDMKEKGVEVTNFIRTQVVTVALETDLNPYNNEIYGCMTPFGDLKVLATMDGWMKIATSESIIERSFKYSDTNVNVTVIGNEYSVPEWIECTLVHKTKGTSIAREYFLEVFENAQHHMPSWSRPARMLSHVAFIQALRRMIRINALSDSDIVADITREYEALATKAQSEILRTDAVEAKESGNVETVKPESKVATPTTSPQKNRTLNIDIDAIEIEGDVEVSSVKPPVTKQVPPTAKAKQPTKQVSETVTAKKEETVQSSPISEKAPEPKPAPKAKAKPQAVVNPTTHVTPGESIIDEVYVNRTVVQMIKPFIVMVESGKISVDTFVKKRLIIKDTLALQWFDQQVERLSKL